MPRIVNRTHRQPRLTKEIPVVSKKAIYTGVSAGLLSYLLLGETGNISLGSMNVPSSVAVGFACAGGSVVSDLTSDYFIDQLDQSASVKSLETNAIKLGVSSAATVGTLYLTSGISPNIMGALTGGASKFLGDSVYHSYDDMILGMLF